MTVLYNVYLVSIWLSNLAALPLAIAAIVFAVFFRNDGVLLALFALLASVLSFWFVYLRLHGNRVLLRAGAWPGLCAGDATPRTEEELVLAAAKIYNATGRPPQVVGSGWGYFLKRSGPVGPRIFLHRFTGRDADTMRWRSGTTIVQLNNFFEKQGMTLKTHPTMDFVSIGSWFSCGNHGNGGASAGKSSDALKNARVLDMVNNEINVWDYKELRQEFDKEYARVRFSPTLPIRFVIIDCEFHSLTRNIQIQKRCVVVESKESAAEWLTPSAHLRLLFLGSARSVGLGVQWMPIYNPMRHKDPHFCSRWCNFFQVDIFSTFGGCYESKYREVEGVKYLTAFEGVTKWREANRWMPLVWPWQLIAVVLAGFINFEIFFKLDKPLDGETLWALVKELIKMHKQFSGRSEIRYGATGGAVCLDVSMNRNFEQVFVLLRRFGVKRVALHLGKYNQASLGYGKYVQRVSLSEL